MPISPVTSAVRSAFDGINSASQPSVSQVDDMSQFESEFANFSSLLDSFNQTMNEPIHQEETFSPIEPLSTAERYVM